MHSENIRIATLKDAASILEIYKASIIDSPTSFEIEVPSIEEMQSRIQNTLEKFPWLVYEKNEQLVGYAYANPWRTRCAYAWSVESTVYVSESHWGQGIGKALYRSLFEKLKSQGVVNVLAGITQPNSASVRLHESLGFVKVAHYKDVGYKVNQWWDVAWWQLQLQKPPHPGPLKAF